MTVLNVIVFGIVALLGLALLRAKFTTQLAGALLVMAAFVFAGVFFPLVTEHLFSEALLLTGSVVALAWLASNAVRWFNDVRETRRERRASAPPRSGLAMAGAPAPVVVDEAPVKTESPPPEPDDAPPQSDDKGKESHNE